MKKKTLLNLLLILFVVAFFVTPLGYQGKLLLNNIFASSATLLPLEQQVELSDYKWRLKDENWEYFSFEKSKGRVAVIVFWASWKLPACEAEMKSVNDLYERYKGQMDFYLITNEMREPVKEFVAKHEITAPITYLIIGDKSPLEITEPPSSYIIDKKGNIVAKSQGIINWNSSKTHKLFDTLLQD